MENQNYFDEDSCEYITFCGHSSIMESLKNNCDLNCFFSHCEIGNFDFYLKMVCSLKRGYKFDVLKSSMSVINDCHIMTFSHKKSIKEKPLIDIAIELDSLDFLMFYLDNTQQTSERYSEMIDLCLKNNSFQSLTFLLKRFTSKQVLENVLAYSIEKNSLFLIKYLASSHEDFLYKKRKESIYTSHKVYINEDVFAFLLEIGIKFSGVEDEKSFLKKNCSKLGFKNVAQIISVNERLKKLFSLEARSVLFTQNITSDYSQNLILSRESIYEDMMGAFVNVSYYASKNIDFTISFVGEEGKGVGVIVEAVKLFIEKVMENGNTFCRPWSNSSIIAPKHSEDKEEIKRMTKEISIIAILMFFCSSRLSTRFDLPLPSFAYAKNITKFESYIKEIEQDVYNSIEAIRSMELPQILPSVNDDEDDIEVTEDNLEEYIESIVKKEVSRCNLRLLKVFNSIIHSKVRDCNYYAFYDNEIKRLFHGSHIDLDTWISITKTNDEKLLDQFWKAVKELDEKERNMLLVFWCSSEILPIGGQTLYLHFQKGIVCKDSSIEPSIKAETCFKKLTLFGLKTKEHMLSCIRATLGLTLDFDMV